MNQQNYFEKHLNLNVRGLPVSATLGINELSNTLIADGRQVYKMGLGQSPFPVPLPVVEELQANAHQKDYLPVRGLPALQQAVVGYYQRTQNLNFRPENILVGPGSKELMFILQLAYYGDLLIPTPSWVSYAPQAHIIGRHVYWLPTHRDNRWLLTPEELDKLCRKDPTKPRIVILNYPNNPTGCSYTDDELKALAEIARKYKIILLSDEIYGELNFEGTHTSVARHYPEGTIISSGLSKWCGAGGWRLGTFAFPAALHWLLEGMAAVSSETFTATSAPIQYAAVRAFRGGPRIEEYLSHSRRILKALSDHVCGQLAAKGAMVAPPQGAFYIFPDFTPLKDKLAARGISNSTEMCEKILEQTGVALLPGTSFGRPDHELTTRLALVDFDGAKALSNSGRYPLSEPLPDDFLGNCCFKVIEGIDRLCDWVNGN
ncbi:MAG: pyridoxal phosphate-dependent aminotransferase [Deltaproteobacteria bacterium]|jgi:aspartate aminotransferase|nr:pyridoxal phosphate-dependent aminotransferase [Deltaproteobacteria bacterium]